MAVNPFSGLTHDAINNQLLSESGRIISGLFYKQKRNIDDYRGMFGQTDFPNNMGTNPTYPIYSATVPVGPIPMTPIGLSNCATADSACDPGFIYVQDLGITQKPMQLYTTPIMRTTDLCFSDLNLAWNPSEFIDQRVSNLVFQTQWMWSYMGLQNLLTGPITKAVMAPYSNNTIPVSYAPTTSPANPYSPTAVSDSLPTIEPTTGMSVGVLQRAYRTFIDLGLTGQDGKSKMFDAYMDPDDFWTMQVNDPAFRQDTRFSSKVDGLRDGLPSIYSGGELAMAFGFRFHPLSYPPRFNFTGGVYVQVLPFGAGTPATEGSVQNTTVAYQTAEIGGMFLVGDPMGYQWRVQNFAQRFGKATFGPNNYAGDFGWQNYQTDHNVLREKGFFTSRIIVGWDFPFPQYIWLVLYLRCQAAIATVSCSATGQPSCDTVTYPTAPAIVNEDESYVNSCVQIP